MRPPSVNDLALRIAHVGLPHPLLVIAARAAIAAGDPDSAADEAHRLRRSLLGPAINATGVLLHTNLGRAPLGQQHGGASLGLEPDEDGPVRFSNLEFDLASGRRGSRTSHASLLLATLTGAEAALVVNNCAAAVTLVLAALARDRGVAVSRGELVEIGGGFRVPEVMEQSGARVVEVGTTNRTRAADYRAAVERDDIALLLKVHPSNYRITGFTEEADVADLAKIGPPVVSDLGSGLLDERCPWLGTRPDWLAGEPGARQTLAAGAALVTFSGDKLMGGPQAGIICGNADLVAACASHPLMRAFRPGSLVLDALQSVALAYLRRDADAIPFWRMAKVPVDELAQRAEALGVGQPARTTALAGAGSLPGQEIPSAGIELDGDHAAALRAHDPPVIARVNEQTTVIDLRTVDPADDAVVAAAVRQALSL
ncbi:L-seryl-tRNA(Sec) selenium transferase [Candidatus Poriferisodalis sp.]|uniref:L-seryl-tRNA(Sec) selenium transferase n=1 Tax=Candidatus Poriferisodalis sp. TaxID=3101277 RepID=UPI003AF838E3